MALSSAERAQVRLYLGWPARFHQTDDRLEQAMNALASTPDDETLIRADMARCAAAFTQLDATDTTGKAVGVGPIQLRVHYQMAAILKRGELAAGRIGAVLGVPFQNNVWRSGGPQAFAGPFGQED